MALTDERGIEHDMDGMTPAMLWKTMVVARKRSAEAGLNEKLRARGMLQGEQEVHWQMVTRASTGLVGREKSLLMQMVWGTVPTNKWLADHGWAVEPTCQCGEQDTLEHRTQCGARGWTGPEVAPVQFISGA